MLRLPSLAVLPLFAWSAMAQQPPAPRPFPPLPLPGAPLPGSAPVLPAANAAAAEIKTVHGLEFPGSDVKDVLQVYER